MSPTSLEESRDVSKHDVICEAVDRSTYSPRCAHRATGTMGVDGVRLRGGPKMQDVNVRHERQLQQAEADSDRALVLEMRARAGLDRGQPAHLDLWIDAREGVIALIGVVDTKEERAVLGVLARTISGCTGVENHLLVRADLRRQRGDGSPVPAEMQRST